MARTKVIEYYIDGVKQIFTLEGSGEFGPDAVLLKNDDDLLEKVSWRNRGYIVAPFLSESSYHKIKNKIDQIIRSTFSNLGVSLAEDFQIEDYHKVANESNELHNQFIAKTRKCFPIEEFPIDKNELLDRISNILQIPVTLKSVHLPEVFCPRICRPLTSTVRDNNPPHRDAWLERLRHGINIYIPITGSDANSSLSLIPGSHLWKESEIEKTTEKALVQGFRFSVPSVLSTKYGMNMTRPEIKNNEFLIFSPYIIHGGATNLNPDKTRISIEMRLFRK